MQLRVSEILHIRKQKRQYVRKKPKADKLAPSPLSLPESVLHPQPGTSTSPVHAPPLGSGDPAGIKRPGQPAPESPNKAKKPKKGHATAKQRLGKILKIHKMVF